MDGPKFSKGINFVDLLFSQLLDKGFKGVTLMTFLNFYMYLSLDKIKELLRRLIMS